MLVNTAARTGKNDLGLSWADEALHTERRRREELANSVSHGIGLLAGIAAIPTLLLTVLRHGAPLVFVGTTVFAVSLLFLYTASTVYHALPRGRSKEVWRRLDHHGIFLLIAGTYTPFMLGVLHGPWGWTLLALVWGAAVGGIIFTAATGARYPRILVPWYLFMGWLALIAIQPLWQRMGLAGLSWIFAGGLAYMGGLCFYAADRRRYCHCVWHVCVMAGTACHFLAVLWYAAG